MGRTPATTVVESAGIDFALHEYEHDPASESYGLEAAERLGVEAARVFKTLLADLDGRLHVAIVPVERQLDLKRLGGKRSAMADPKRVERSTGYVLGGVSPLGQRRTLPTTLDTSALDHTTIFVCGGRRGLEVARAPIDRVVITAAEVRPIAR